MVLESFIDVSPDSHFPIQNLPFGIFKPGTGPARAGVAIGDLVLDLSVLEELGHFAAVAAAVPGGHNDDMPPGTTASTASGPTRIFAKDCLNDFAALGRPAWRKGGEIIQRLLASDTSTLRDDASLRERTFHAQKDVVMQLPVRIGNYTDFYSSYHHAHNVGTMLRGAENALMPNWKWLPVAYHGRASSIVASGTDVRRPKGQTKSPDAPGPIFGPSKRLEFELEVGVFFWPCTSFWEPLPPHQAHLP